MTHRFLSFPAWKTFHVIVLSETQGCTLCQNTSSGKFGGKRRTTVFKRSEGWGGFSLRSFSFSRSFLGFVGGAFALGAADIDDRRLTKQSLAGVGYYTSGVAIPMIPINFHFPQSLDRTTP